MVKPEKIAKLIKSSNRDKAQDAIRQALEMGKSDPAAFKEFVKIVAKAILTEKKDYALRYIVTAGIIGKEYPMEVKPLILPMAKRMVEEDEEIRYKAAYSLYLIAHKEPRAIKDAIPTMVKILDDVVDQGAYPSFKSYKPYTTMLKSLKLVAKKYPALLKKAIPVLMRCIDYPIYHPENPSLGLDEFYPEAIEAIAYLSRRFGKETVEAIPLIVRAYIDSYRYQSQDAKKLTKMRDSVLDAVNIISENNSTQLLQYILEYISNPHNHGRKLAEELLAPTFKHPDAIASVLIHNFDSKNSDIKEKAASVMARMLKENPKAVIKPLKNALKKGTPDEKKYVLSTISLTAKTRIDIAVQFFPDLVDRLKDSDQEIRWYAADAIGAIAVNRPDLAAKAVSYLIGALGDDAHQVRWAALYAISRIAEAHGMNVVSQAVPVIIKLTEDPYDQVRWKAIETLKKMNIDRYRYSAISNDLSAILREINDLKSLLAQGEYRTLMDTAMQAKKHLDSHEYKEAEKMLEKLKDDAAKAKVRAKDDRKVKAATVLKELRVMRDSASASGYDVKHLDNIIEKAKEALKQGLYEDVYAAKEEMKEVIKRLEAPAEGAGMDSVNLWEIINWLEGQVKAEKAEGTDTSEAEELIDKAKRAINIGMEPSVVMGYITDAKIALKNSRTNVDEKGQKVAHEAVASALAVITSAKAKGVDTSAAEQMLSEAELGMKQGDWTKAIKLASKAEEETNKKLKIAMLGQASEHLIEIQNWIKDAENFGLDTTEAVKFVKEAKKAFKEDDYESVEKYIKMIKDNLDRQKSLYVQNQAKALFNSMMAQVKEAEVEGLDMTDIEPLKLSAEEAYHDGKFDELYEISIKIGEEIESMRHRKARDEAKEMVEKAEKRVAHLGRLGLITEDIKSRMKKAKEYFEKEMYAQAKSHANELSFEIETILEVGYKSALRSKINEMQKRLDRLESEGYDVLEARNIMQKVIDSFDAKEYDAAEEALGEIEGHIMETQHQKEMEDSTTKFFRIRVEKELDELRDMALTGEALELMQKAEELYNNGDYTEALKYAKKAKKAAG